MVKEEDIIEFRLSKKGRPYVKASTLSVKSLIEISPKWRVKADVAAEPPFWLSPEVRTTTKAQHFETTKTTSIRVETEDWDWFVQDCRARGTSTCREIRSMVAALRTQAEYPLTKHRRPGYVG